MSPSKSAISGDSLIRASITFRPACCAGRKRDRTRSSQTRRSLSGCQDARATPEKSLVKRTAKLTLSDDGTLEGDVEIQYTGQLAIGARKRTTKTRPAARRASDQRDQRADEHRRTHQHPRRERDRPRQALHLYVSRESSGLRGAHRQAALPATGLLSARCRPDVSDQRPRKSGLLSLSLVREGFRGDHSAAGFALDNADVPTPIGAGKVSQYTVRMAVTEDKRTLIYSRTFTFGTPEIILFPEEPLTRR